MHDFAEHYGRYSGGPPDAYEYSERTVEHRHGYGDHLVGFTVPLRRADRLPGPRGGPEEHGRPEGRGRPPAGPAPGRAETRPAGERRRRRRG